MLIFEIALFIFIITMILFLSTRVLWLFFLLFCYRFWESILSFKTLAKILPIETMKSYHITLFIIAIITYCFVLLSARAVPSLQYILLVVIAIWVLREYNISDVLFFKDYLEDKGMWSIAYWIHQVKELFTISPDKAQGVLDKVWKTVIDFFQNVLKFIKAI